MNNSKKVIERFRDSLIHWESLNYRPMPWKGIKDPYLIWLSEIILQQTRVQQGWEYFLKFKKAFPNVSKLAKADEQKVLKLWQGLGYYSRARNLHFTAKFIHQAGGKFKADYKWLLSLKGVGPYTAAAIASFAFDLPYAVVDGNVYRVLSRIFAIETPIDSSAGKKQFQLLADQLLDKKNPSTYNQAIIDFGATLCTPKQPNCLECPFEKSCLARQENRIDIFPVKEKKIKKKKRFFNYLDIRYKGKRLFRERIAKDVWKGLYDFPLIETSKPAGLDVLKQTKEWRKFMDGFAIERLEVHPKLFKQELTHQSLIGRFYILQVKKIPKQLEKQFKWATEKNIESLPFPKMISFYLEDKDLYLIL